MKLVLAAALVAGTWLAPAPVLADAPALQAEAGLSGMGRAGRFAPVRVLVQNAGEDFTGEVVVGWGDATVHRSVTLGSPARRQFDIYIRTFNVRSVMTVQLQSRGVTLRSVVIPMRVAPLDDDATLCVSPAGAFSAEDAECTTSVMAASLPRSMRGYDAVDRVVWHAGSDEVLDAEQRVAFRRWQAYRRLEDSGALSLSPRLSSAGGGIGGSGRSLALVAVATYVLLIMAIGVLALTNRSRPLRVYAALALLAALGSSVGLAAGRLGPGSVVRVRSATTLQQLRDCSLISLRGAAQYPAFDSFQLQAGLRDAALELTSGSRGEEWIDDEGYPTVSGVFGFGSRQELALEGVIPLSWLEIGRRSGMVRVTNVSRVDLRDCRFPEGFSFGLVGILRPGQTVEAREVEAVDVPFFTCSLPEAPVEFTDPRYAVRVEGPALVTAYLPPDVEAIARGQ